MTTLLYVEPELIIGLNRTIIFVNPNDHQIFKSIELPEKLSIPEIASEKPEETEKKSNANKNEPLKIQQVCYAPNRTLFAVTTSGQKSLLLYRCRPENAWLISTRAIARAASALKFSSDSESLLVTDKTGDCYLYDCVNLDEPPRLLLGHLSIVNDVIWTADKKRIITCDRDDKIRVTNYPETHDIHGYCLGHKEFVSALKWLEGDIIISISGDKTLRLWNYESCKELAKIELPGPAIRFDVREIDKTRYQVAILHQLDDCVSMHELLQKEDGTWESKELKTCTLENIAACNLCWAEGRLYVAGVVNEKFALKFVSVSDAVPPKDKWIEIVEEQFQQYSWTPEDVTTWFKKRFDNVTEYLERKKRRIDEKQK